MHSLSRPLNSWDIAKIIALLLMFVDHTGNWLVADEDTQAILRAIGRGAAPIFLFLAGYATSYRFSRELLALALLLTLSDTLLLGHISTQNILVTILVYRMIFQWFETRGRIIKRPYEWLVGSVVLFGLGGAMQYGGLGFMWALWGYMQRRPQHYPASLQRNFRLLTIIIYTLYYAAFSIPAAPTPLLVLTLAATGWYLWKLRIYDVSTDYCPAWLVALAKLTARYSGYIYVFHLIALEWITRIPL